MYTSTHSNNSKNIVVTIAESGKEHNKLIFPGTTSSMLVKEIGLKDEYVLSPGKGLEAFPDDQDLYPIVPDKAILWACQPMTVALAS